MAVGRLPCVADVVDEAALECAFEYLLLVVDEHADALVLQFSDDAGPQVDHLFVIIGNTLVDDTLKDMLLCRLVEEIEQQAHRLVVRKNFKLVGIFEVHDLVADVIGGLYKIDQRMAGIAQRLADLRLTDNAKFFGYPTIVSLLGVEEPEFSFLACGRGRVWVFYDAGKG